MSETKFINRVIKNFIALILLGKLVNCKLVIITLSFRMLRPDTPLSDHSQCEEQESPDQDWVQLSSVQQPVGTMVTQSESGTGEGTVGETTAP